MTFDSDRWVGREGVQAWLAQHGVDMAHVCHIEIVPESFKEEGRCHLRIERYVLDDQGRRFIDRSRAGTVVDEQGFSGYRAAVEVVWVPLKSFPVADATTSQVQ